MGLQGRSSGIALDELAGRLRPNSELGSLSVRRGGPDWIHELKLDGYRLGAAICGTAVRPISRKGNDLTSEFSEVSAALRALDLRDAFVDGEVVVLDPSGRNSMRPKRLIGPHVSERR
jgi:ATP-dependent DNA ligase